MGLLPMDIDILPPSDDRVFKLILTSPEAKPVLIDLIASTIRRPVVDVVVRNNELPLNDTEEKAERLDVNCRIDDGSQVDKEALQMAGNLLMSVSKDERERAINRSRRMYQSDLESNIATVEQRKALAIARNLFKTNLPLDQIATATGLTIEEVKSLHDASINTSDKR